jgi:hypothetical protein
VSALFRSTEVCVRAARSAAVASIFFNATIRPWQSALNRSGLRPTALRWASGRIASGKLSARGMEAPPTSTGITGLRWSNAAVISITTKSSAPACFQQRGPARSNYAQDHIGGRDRGVNNLDKVVAGLDVAFHIHEQVIGRELGFKALIQRLREARIVAPAIVDEDFACHERQSAATAFETKPAPALASMPPEFVDAPRALQ